jgi:hypothetical protein
MLTDRIQYRDQERDTGKVESQQFSQFENGELAAKLERAAKEKAREEHKETQRQHRSSRVFPVLSPPSSGLQALQFPM